MKMLHEFADWVRDPFGNKQLKRRHRDVRKDMIETLGRTEEVTAMIRNEHARNERRRLRAEHAHVVERAVLGQPKRRAAP